MDSRNRERLIRALNARRRAARAIEAAKSQAATEALRISVVASDRTRALLEAASNGSIKTPEVMRNFDQLLAAARDQTEGALHGGVVDALDIAVAAAVDNAEIMGITLRRLAVIENQFNASFRPDLISASYNRWIQRIPGETLKAERGLQEALTKAILKGESAQDAARRLLASSDFTKAFQTAGQFLRRDVAFSNLPVIEQKIAPLHRALRVIRTEIGRVDNVTGISFAEAAGFSKFINIGVGDDRQSDECAAATAADPMTLAEWSANLGIAPRHPNCRCGMAAVPDDATQNLPEKTLVSDGVLAEA